MSTASEITDTHNIHSQSLIDIEVSILTKSIENLPKYFYRDKKNVLRSKESNRRAFRSIGSADVIDAQGEIVDLEVIRKSMDDMMDMGGLMLYNHKNINAAKVLGWGDITILDEELNKEIDAIYIDFELFDKYPIHKEIERRIDLPSTHPDKIRGLSIGGRKLKKVRECNKNGCYNRVTEIENHEFSLTERMSNPLSVFIMKTHTETKPIGEMLTKFKGDKMKLDPKTGEPVPIDQSEVTLAIPAEHVHADSCGCPESLNKSKETPETPETLETLSSQDLLKMDEKDKDKDKDEDEDEDEDEDYDEDMEKSSIDKLTDAVVILTKHVKSNNDRLVTLESGIKVKKVKVPQTITKDGQIYVLTKSKPKKKKVSALDTLSSEIETLSKGKESLIIPQQSLEVHTNSEAPRAATRKEQEMHKIRQMDIGERLTHLRTTGKSTRAALEDKGIYLQN